MMRDSWSKTILDGPGKMSARPCERPSQHTYVHCTILPVDSLPKSSYTFKYRVLREGNNEFSHHTCIFHYYPIEGYQETFDDARLQLQHQEKRDLEIPLDFLRISKKQEISGNHGNRQEISGNNSNFSEGLEIVQRFS